MAATTVREAIYNIIMEQDCILLIQVNGFWKLPGGVISPGVGLLDQIFCHIKSELPTTDTWVAGQYFGAIDTDNCQKTHMYFTSIGSGRIYPGANISGAGWFKNTSELKLETTTAEIMNLLRQLGHIK